MPHRTTARIAGTAISLATAATGLALIAPANAATAPAVAPEATSAAQWVAGTIGEDGLLPGTSSSAFAYGANLDFGISLALLGQESSAALAKLQPGIDATIAGYVGDIDDPAKAGSVAKAAYYYAATGGDASDAGASHLDLVAALKADVDDTTGQLGSTASVYNQVWAVLALEELGDDEAEKARDFLLTERGPAADDAWGYDAGTWTNDPDATSYAVLALAPWADEAPVQTAIGAGVTYLSSSAVQKADGGIDLGWGTGPNANSTGLAAAALGAVGNTAAAAKAATWIADHQIVALPACGVTSTNAGAVAYDDSARTAGVTSDTLAQFVSAAAQALAGFAYLPASKASVAAPTGFVPAGSAITVRVAGLRTGQQACVSGGAAPVKVTGPGAVTVRVPAGTATRTLRVSALGTTSATTVKALAGAKLKLTGKAKVKRGKKLTVTIAGLAAGEKVTVKLGKKSFGTATANAGGKAIVRSKVAKKAKVGKVRLSVTGQFANRNGSRTIKVTR